MLLFIEYKCKIDLIENLPYNEATNTVHLANVHKANTSEENVPVLNSGPMHQLETGKTASPNKRGHVPLITST